MPCELQSSVVRLLTQSYLLLVSGLSLESYFDVLIYGFVLIQMFESCSADRYRIPCLKPNHMTHAIPDKNARKNSFYT
jgi:hypothetical protein